MKSPIDRNEGSVVEREGEAQSPAAGRDMDRPRGGIKGPLLGLGLLVLLVVIGLLATLG